MCVRGGMRGKRAKARGLLTKTWFCSYSFLPMAEAIGAKSACTWHREAQANVEKGIDVTNVSGRMLAAVADCLNSGQKLDRYLSSCFFDCRSSAGLSICLLYYLPNCDGLDSQRTYSPPTSISLPFSIREAAGCIRSF